MKPLYTHLRELYEDVSIATHQLSADEQQALEARIPELIKSFSSLRSAADKVVVQGYIKEFKKQKKKGIFDVEQAASINEYPIGCCREIVPAVLATAMKKTSIRKAAQPLKEIYGILDKKYFHRAIQLGHLFVDVANDTVDKDQTPVVIKLLSEMPFAPMTDYETVASVIENYWEKTVHQNKIYPLLALHHPYFLTNGDSGYVALPRVHINSMLWNETQHDYEAAINFLFSLDFQPKEPSAQAEQQLIDKIGSLNERIETFSPYDNETNDLFRKMCTPSEDFKKDFYHYLGRRNKASEEQKEAFDFIIYNLSYILQDQLEKELMHLSLEQVEGKL